MPALAPTPPKAFRDPPLTPGAYLKRRRQAARMSISDVAARVSSEPRIAQHVRAAHITLIEADVQPASFATIIALRRAYRFDLGVLERLVAIGMGLPQDPPPLCRICACSHFDACAHRLGTCSWVEPDLCSACDAPVGHVAGFAA